MITDDEIYEIIYNSIDEVNSMLPMEEHLVKLPETLISREGSGLNSLGVLNFVVSLEEQIEIKTGCCVSFADNLALNQEVNPLENVKTIKDYIRTVLG